MPLLTAEEAARRLGVRKTTLYTYASRGLLRVVKEGRTSRYVAEDVDSLRIRAAAAHGHEAAAAAALDWGAPILETSITSIESDGPRYRGRPATALAATNTPFEAVFELLVEGRAPQPRGAGWLLPAFPPCDLGVPEAPLDGDTPIARLTAFVARSSACDELRLATSGEAERRRRRNLVRRMIAVNTGRFEPLALTAPTVGEALAHAFRIAPDHGPALSRALVLCADHELNASAFAARVAAGTGADTLSCVVAALATLSGPRHGGATDRVERLLAPVGSLASAKKAIAVALGGGAALPGFGHRLYPHGDPRAVALLADAARLEPAGHESVAAFAALGRDATGQEPTLDLGLVALARALRLPPGGASALFAIGRTAGWLAHVAEQRESGRMLRPRASFVG